MCQNNLIKNLNYFIEERLNDSYVKITSKKEYQKIKAKYSKLFSDIEKIVEDKELLDNYEIVQMDMYSMQLEQAYKTGFIDSLLLLFEKNI